MANRRLGSVYKIFKPLLSHTEQRRSLAAAQKNVPRVSNSDVTKRFQNVEMSSLVKKNGIVDSFSH